jgi:hypothetical protein
MARGCRIYGRRCGRHSLWPMVVGQFGETDLVARRVVGHGMAVVAKLQMPTTMGLIVAVGTPNRRRSRIGSSGVCSRQRLADVPACRLRTSVLLRHTRSCVWVVGDLQSRRRHATSRPGGRAKRSSGRQYNSVELARRRKGASHADVFDRRNGNRSRCPLPNFNGDAFPDIAISNSLPMGTDSTCRSLFGDGKGGFSERLPSRLASSVADGSSGFQQRIGNTGF